MGEFYAHSANSCGEWETLECHLGKTAELSEKYAEVFGEGTAGKWLGIFHDAGKASDLFQGVLKGEQHNVDHAAAGACMLYSLNRLLARVIYAHHDGLRWYIDNIKESLSIEDYQGENGRFAVSGKAQYLKLKDYMKPFFPEEKPVLMDNAESYYKNLSEMLHARVLLSCLCDADYTATASHYDETVPLNDNNTLNAHSVLDSLIEYRSAVKKNSTADKKLNEIRDSVFNDCLKAAESRSGMFTLTAPTGTGKTLALLAFAAKHAMIHDKKRIIVVLPFLSIITQNAGIYREICGDVLEAHSMAEYDEKQKLLSERWDSPIVITTSVKFFEAFFKRKPTDLRFLHSIADSVIVFDEAQCIPPGLTGTTIETMRTMCEMFRCTVLLSTATQPAFDIRKDIKFSPCEVVSDIRYLYDNTRRVTVEWDIDEPVSLTEIAALMAEKESVCCVLNRKDHTGKLYELLSGISCREECFHISTDMCSSHRNAVIKEINNRLRSGLPCRLVSTSCIEAGVDLDFSYMYRALAPLESVIQCAGRCNRNGKQSGIMKVFVPDEEKLYPTDSYSGLVMIVKTILTRHEIDIYNTDHIREYYSELFNENNNDHDKKELVRAIDEHDFEEAEKQYRFIPQSGVNVLVPYSGAKELFDELAAEAETKGISKKWMRRAAPVTVTSYYEEKLRDLSMQCFTFKNKEKKCVPGWYILLSDKLYNDSTGLHFDDESSLEYLI